MPVRRVLWILILLFPLLFFGCKTESFYPQIVIDTFTANNATESQTDLTLYDASDNEIAYDDDGNPDQVNHKSCSRIDYQGGLPSGTYYIRVSNPTGATTSPNYGIRVLTFDPGSSFPSVDPENEDEEFVFIDNDASGNRTTPWSIELGEVVSRSIYLWSTDVDWFVLVLP